jgi:hypothetical protein
MKGDAFELLLDSPLENEAEKDRTIAHHSNVSSESITTPSETPVSAQMSYSSREELISHESGRQVQPSSSPEAQEEFIIDEDADSEDSVSGPTIPFQDRILALPSQAWQWIKANKGKTLIIIIILAVLAFIIFEVANGALTQVMSTVLAAVRTLGAGV